MQDEAKSRYEGEGNGRYPHINTFDTYPDLTEPESDYLTQIWAKRARALAEPPPAEIKGERIDLIKFGLNKGSYGLEIHHVDGVYPLPGITSIPRTPTFVVGVCLVRGQILPIIDLCAFWGMPNLVVTEESKIIAVTIDDGQEAIELGVLTDDVKSITTVFKADLSPDVDEQINIQAEYIQGITPDLTLVLNLRTLLYDKRLIIHEATF